MKKTLKERFDEKWKLIEETGCWEWTGTMNGGKYPMISFPVKTEIGSAMVLKVAHRISYSFKHGDIPDDVTVRRSCGNPKCVNPDHLYISSRQDTLVDMYNNGGFDHSKGEDQWNSKLTQEQVLQIFSDSRKNKEIALDYGVNRTAIAAIKSGRNWGWLTGKKKSTG
jgi:HNH endonuclease